MKLTTNKLTVSADCMLVVSLWLVMSPLQSKIVFYSQRAGNYEIYTMGSDGAKVNPHISPNTPSPLPLLTPFLTSP